MAATLNEWKESKCNTGSSYCCIAIDNLHPSLRLSSSTLTPESITVVTCDGRLLVGILVGHDQVQNLILKDAEERIYSEEDDVEIVPLGLYMIRGDNVALIGEADWKESDSALRAEPIPVVQQHTV